MPTTAAATARRLAPGLALVGGLGAVAWALSLLEAAVLGQAVLEALVLAILLGILVRTAIGIPAAAGPGVAFGAKPVLELAIVLLGGTVDLPTVLGAGVPLLAAIALVVTAGIVVSTALGRALGLNPRLATLVAVGNSICGNSAIAAVAPVIGATAEDIASAVALTAVIGVVLVLALPLAIPLLGYTLHQYGVLAGMTVYAVPQVLAATIPVGTASAQVATLVKLVRVMLLGPVVVAYGLRRPRDGAGEAAGAGARTAGSAGTGPASVGLGRFVPWFLAGFLVLAAARSLGLVPPAAADVLRETSRWLTVAAMAALGLGVDIRVVRQVGRAVALTVVGSLAALLALAIVLIRVLAL